MGPDSIEKQDSSYVNEYTEGYSRNKNFTWKRARKVKLFFYKQVLTKLPKEEKYQLRGQIRDAAISCTSNIAEGYGRFHYQEAIQFYRIAGGSLAELKDHLISCLALNYVNKNLYEQGIELIEGAKIKLNGYIAYTKKQKMNS